jgi:DNA-binding response OmpR family regulator
VVTISIIYTFKPDLILLDEFINSKPGHRLCRKIKQVPNLAVTPVIILSTANDIELIVEECGANDHIRKPFDIEDLIIKVLRLLSYQPLTHIGV